MMARQIIIITGGTSPMPNINLHLAESDDTDLYEYVKNECHKRDELYISVSNICIDRVQLRILTASTTSVHIKPSNMPPFSAISVRETNIPAYHCK